MINDRTGGPVDVRGARTGSSRGRLRMAAAGSGGVGRKWEHLFPEGTRGARGHEDLPAVEGGTVVATVVGRDSAGGEIVVRAVAAPTDRPWLEVFGHLHDGAGRPSAHWVRVTAKECETWKSLQREFCDLSRGRRCIEAVRMTDPAEVEAYHGTNVEFTRFDPATSHHGGFFFASKPEDAQRYAELKARYTGSPRVMRVRLRIARDGWSRLQRPDLARLLVKEQHAKLQAEGYDGYHEPGGMYVVFSPDNICVEPTPRLLHEERERVLRDQEGRALSEKRHQTRRRGRGGLER
jgi:hypothetical protein